MQQPFPTEATDTVALEPWALAAWENSGRQAFRRRFRAWAPTDAVADRFVLWLAAAGVLAPPADDAPPDPAGTEPLGGSAPAGGLSLDGLVREGRLQVCARVRTDVAAYRPALPGLCWLPALLPPPAAALERRHRRAAGPAGPDPEQEGKVRRATAAAWLDATREGGQRALDEAIEQCEKRLRRAGGLAGGLADLPETARRAILGRLHWAVRKGWSEDSLQKWSTDLKKVLEKASAHTIRVLTEERVAQLLGAPGPAGRPQRYHELFPRARALGPRRVVFFCGPTNSGKTYQGFQRLCAHGAGVYLAPLRLLALEGRDQIEARGHPCSLVTGEEREERADARFSARTVEMAEVESPGVNLPAALIDEVQMLQDPDRGWAWTRALVGLPVPNLYLTGDAGATELVRELCRLCGDELEIVRLERRLPLEVLDQPVPEDQLRAIEPGTALIAFSRAAVLDWREQLVESLAAPPPRGQREKAPAGAGGFAAPVAVVYGALSPEVRRAQASDFRAGRARLLVATDAIGMGLNLPIRTVLFTALEKFDGREVRALTVREIRQIAGRAGRDGFGESAGYVGALNKRDLERLRRALGTQPAPALPRLALIRPSVEQLEEIARALGDESLARCLEFYAVRLAPVRDDFYQVARSEEFLSAALLADGFTSLPLRTRFVFACAPLRPGDPHLMNWLEAAASGEQASAPEVAAALRDPAGTVEREVLATAEHLLHVLGAYRWLGYRLPATFPAAACRLAAEQSVLVDTFVIASLRRRHRARRCRDCSRPLPPGFRFALCEGCYHSNRPGWD